MCSRSLSSAVSDSSPAAAAEVWKHPNDGGSELILGAAEDVLPTIAAGRIGMVLCDPPYDVVNQKWDKPLPWETLWPEIWRCCRPDAAAVFFASMPFTLDLAASQRKHFRYSLVWLKHTSTQHLLANLKPMSIHEDILVFYRQKTTYFPQMSPGKAYRRVKPAEDSIYGKFPPIIQNNEGRFPVSVLAYNKEGLCNGYHPSQKPVPLLEFLIKSYTRIGEFVLDLTMGSGSACVAAQNTGRRFIGVEKDREFFDIAKKRVEEARKLFAN